MSTSVNDKPLGESNHGPETEGKLCPNQLPVWHIVKRECSVLDCGNNSSKCRMFAFPDCTSNEENYRDKCRIWLKACGNKILLDLDLSNIHEQAFICSLHFDENQFKDETREELLAIAVPSIHLPVQISGDKLDEYFARFPSGTKPDSGSQHNGDFFGVPGIKSEARVKYLKCPSCTKQFQDQDAVDTHWKLIHCDEGPLECTLCNKTFLRGCDYRRHCRIHTTKMRHVCVECEKCFPSKVAYDKHRKSSHSKNSPFVCEPCNRRFSSSSCLKSHLRIHSNEKKFACTVCAERFFTNSSLKAHRLTHNAKDSKCKVCGKIYPDKESLKDHFKDHEKETPYACDNCSRRFPSQKFLIIHMRTHSEISFKCKDCNKRFSTEESLQVHIKSHLDDEPAICPHCKTRFATLNRLVHHYCKNLRGKRNLCPVCFQQFSARSVLEIHMAIHDTTKEPNKAYACSVCYKRFMTKTRLDSHVVTEHDSGYTGGSRHVATTEEDAKSNVGGIQEETGHTEAIKEEGVVGEEDEDGQGGQGDEDSLTLSEDTKISIKLEPSIEQDSLNQNDVM